MGSCFSNELTKSKVRSRKFIRIEFCGSVTGNTLIEVEEDMPASWIYNHLQKELSKGRLFKLQDKKDASFSHIDGAISYGRINVNDPSAKLKADMRSQYWIQFIRVKDNIVVYSLLYFFEYCRLIIIKEFVKEK